MAIERDLRQSGRTASVDQTDARKAVKHLLLRWMISGKGSSQGRRINCPEVMDW
jgi:hypothetical protein